MITQIKKPDYTDKSCQTNLCNLFEICAIIFYDLIFFVFCLIYLPYLLWAKKFHKGLWQRIGFYPKEIRNTAGGCIWLHAVSVGEVVAIRPLWERIRHDFPSKRIVVSTVTRTGNELARNFSKTGEIVFYLPLDFSFVIKRFLKKIRPAIVVIAETEIWPNLLTICHKNNIPIAVVNGRISEGAFKRYKLVRPLLKGILNKVDIFCVRSDSDRERFIALGVAAEKLKVCGNTKYCDADGKMTERHSLKQKLGVKDTDLILIAGSTHKGEEEIIIEIFAKLRQEIKNLWLIIAPRHIERAKDVKRLTKGLPVTIVDKMGVLKDLYSISDLVFIGGSLVKSGGHNIIEPAVFGKPILFGPYMNNFKNVADEFLKANAAIMVEDKDSLEISCRRLLKDGTERSRLGENARQVVLKNQGAVESCIGEIKKVLYNA